MRIDSPGSGSSDILADTQMQVQDYQNQKKVMMQMQYNDQMQSMGAGFGSPNTFNFGVSQSGFGMLGSLLGFGQGQEQGQGASGSPFGSMGGFGGGQYEIFMKMATTLNSMKQKLYSYYEAKKAEEAAKKEEAG